MTAALRPLCRNCGATIHKLYRSCTFGQVKPWGDRHFTEFPDSLDEVMRLTGAIELRGVSWKEDGERWIGHVIVWRGEYRDAYFCGKACARLFGYHACRTGMRPTKEHAAKLAKQKAKADDARRRADRGRRRTFEMQGRDQKVTLFTTEAVSRMPDFSKDVHPAVTNARIAAHNERIMKGKA